MRRLRKGDKVLRPSHPNAGIRAEYRRRLESLIEDMADSYRYWLTAAYKANKPEMAQDAAPVRVTAVQSGPRAWHAYIDGKQMRTRSGGARVFRSQEAAETTGMHSVGVLGELTRPLGIGESFDIHTLEVVRTPAQNMEAALADLGQQWKVKFDAAAPKLGRWFAQSSTRRSDESMKKILKDSGYSVEFQMTPVMRDIVDATIAENVGLIKSIGSEYHSQVQGAVMRSITAGRDIGGLTKELEHRYGITHRRAAGIAIDQNNKATSNMTKARQIQNNLMAVWLHSGGAKVPRHTHVANSGNVYDPKVGWFDPDPKVRKRIWPGQLIKCGCVSRTVIPGLS